MGKLLIFIAIMQVANFVGLLCIGGAVAETKTIIIKWVKKIYHD